MLNYAVLSKKPEHFRNFSGITTEEFNTLNQQITQKYPTYEQKRLQRQNRKRNIGAGHPFKQTLTDRLLMLLIYYHLYTSSTLLSYLFGVSQSGVLKNIRRIEPLVRETLPLPSKEYQKIKKIETVTELETMFPGFEAFLDAT
ncbi:MAG: transposase family protein, partial [Nitrososphaerota archaeon]|nr:transposase family protein [Nitrososphaerota archaeon]